MSEQSDLTAEHDRKPVRRRLRFKVSVAILAIVLGTGAFLILRPATPPDAISRLQDGFPGPRKSLNLISRLPRSIQPFAYRVKYAVFGVPKPVHLNAAILHFELAPEMITPRLSLAEPQFTGTNAGRVWILTTNHLQNLHSNALKLSRTREVASPRIVTAHEATACMAVTRTMSVNGTLTPLGLMLNCLPYVRRDSIDLTMQITLTEVSTNNAGQASPISIQTNSIGALRMRIPDGSGAFILHQGFERLESTGVILSPAVVRTKK